MGGKFLFVVGLGVGYLLGTRAGRKRYEQIKATALQLWESEPVQWGVTQVQEAAGDLAGQAVTAAKQAIASAQGKPAKKPPAGSTKSGASAPKSSATSEKRAAARPSPKPATPLAEPSARSGVATGTIPIIPPKTAE